MRMKTKSGRGSPGGAKGRGLREAFEEPGSRKRTRVGGKGPSKGSMRAAFGADRERRPKVPRP